ncbi:MAG: metallophosphoesterase [Pirellulales bacterium]
MFDLIGDIHGHAGELTSLLEMLGYGVQQGIYRHPERTAVFVGDFIDRGPQIREVLGIVRPMCEAGSALAVMGNHELNALAFHTPDTANPGQFLREHSPKNVKQHAATMKQVPESELRDHLEWFCSLPLWLDLGGLRVVHACWDERAMSQIAGAHQNHGGVTTEFLHLACRNGEPLFAPVEIVLKGKEGQLPEGMSFRDKDGHVRTEIRTRWYLPPDGHTYRTYALQSDEIACDLELDPTVIDAAAPYPVAAKPVFIGHYWLSAQRPTVLADNVACLDFSVAKGGFLCAYRWNGEQKLSNENFVWVKRRHSGMDTSSPV